MDRPLRILHLEDDAMDAELARATLKDGGLPCEVVRVETREEFEAAQGGGQFDLVLSDYSLPSFDGARALAFARQHHPEIPFIIVSGTIGEDAAINSLLGGATDYVLKDRLGRLVPAVRRALAEAEERRERRRAEEGRRATEQKYRCLFEASKDGLLILDGETLRVVDANPAFLELLGYGRDEVVGRSLPEVGLAGQDLARELAADGAPAVAEGRYPGQRLRDRDGREVEVDIVRNAYQAEGQRFVQLSVRDIRERRRLERQLQTSQKLEVVGQLAGGVAHDFNNILAVITSYTELAVDSLSSRDPLRADLEQVGAAAARAAALVRQLLAFGRRQVLQPIVLSLNAIVADLEPMLRRVLGEQIDLRVRLAQDLGSVRADPAQVEQVLMNLVVNARDAMPTGGVLTVETRGVTLDDAYACGHPGVQPGSYVQLAVADSGSGMDAETLGRIFEPFFTTKAPGRGTGLGLSTVYGIVRQSGGHVYVYSEVGVGTTFRILLPLDAGAPASARAAPPGPAEGGTESVLVVEDDESVRRLIPRLLEPAGYSVLSAASAEEALRHCAQRPGAIDLLLTDVSLPGRDGFSLAAQVRALRPGIRVVFMTGHLDDLLAQHGVPAGEGDLLHKPFTAVELLLKLRQALSRGAAPPARAEVPADPRSP